MANPNFACINLKNFELLPQQDFKWEQTAALDSSLIEKEICETLVEAIQACNDKGMAYLRTIATVKKAEIRSFSAECPNVRCAGNVFENENESMICQKCGIEYNACNHNVALGIDVSIDNSTYKMVSKGNASFAFLAMGSFEFIHSYAYEKIALMAKIEALSGQKFSLLLKMTMNSATKSVDFIIEEASKEENRKLLGKRAHSNE